MFVTQVVMIQSGGTGSMRAGNLYESHSKLVNSTLTHRLTEQFLQMIILDFTSLLIPAGKCAIDRLKRRCRSHGAHVRVCWKIIRTL